MTGVTPEELALLLHAAYRRAYMAQVPGMPCPAWDEMPVTHGPRVAVAVQAGMLAAAREALARAAGGQEAGELRAVAAEVLGKFAPYGSRPDYLRAYSTAEEVAGWRARLDGGHG